MVHNDVGWIGRCQSADRRKRPVFQQFDHLIGEAKKLDMEMVRAEIEKKKEEQATA